MNTFYVNSSEINDNQTSISGDDYHHIKNVLRIKPNERVYICDENGTRYEGTLKEYSANNAIFELLKSNKQTSELSLDITLYQGMPKSDKMDYIIQKSTELGVKKIVPVNMQYSVAKVTGENNSKISRWNKIAKEAASQSGRQIIPKVLAPIYFKNIIENIEKYDIVLLLYENEHSVTLKDVIKGNSFKSMAIIIGPEGGFSESEIDLLSKCSNVKVVTLGNRILRTETAGIATLAMISYEVEQ